MSDAADAAAPFPRPRTPPTAPALVRRLALFVVFALLAPAAGARQDGRPASKSPPRDAELADDEEIVRQVDDARQELDEARREHDRFEQIYQRQRALAAGAPATDADADLRPPDEKSVAGLLDRLGAETSFLHQLKEGGELRRLEAITRDRREQLAQSDAPPAERAERRVEVDRRAALIAELARLRDALDDVRGGTLALLRRENLFLQGSTRISRDALEQGFSDLTALPRWLLERARALPAWFAVPANRDSLLEFLAALLPMALAATLARRWTARHVERLLRLDLRSLPVRTTLVLANLLRVACTSAFLWLAPLLASALIRGLPESAGELLNGFGRIAALFWLGLGVNRELLRPQPPQRSVLDVDAKTAARVGAGVTLLLGWSLVLLSIEHLLTRLAYDNDGALEAIDLVHKVVTGAIASVLLFRRQLLMSLLPAPNRPLGRFLHRIAGLLHATLILLVPALVVLQLLRFRILAGFMTRAAILLLAAFPLGSIVYHSIVFFLDRWRGRANARAGDDEEQARRVEAIDGIVRFLLRAAIVVASAGAILAATGTSFADARTFLERPLPLQSAGPGQTPVTWWNVTLAALIAYVILRSARHLHIALERLILPLTGLARATQYTITTVVDYVVIGLGLWLAVSQLVEIRNLGYLVAALSVGIGFGLQEIISNFVSGLILLFERPIKPGDLVEIGAGTLGTVRALGIRATTVRTGENVHVLVPNREFITQRVVNYDLLDPRYCLTIKIGVACSSDPKRVREALLEIAGNDGRVLKRPAPDVFFTDFGVHSLEFKLQVWIESAHTQGRVGSDLRFAIDAAFKRLGIEIPFPQRDVALRASEPLRVLLERPADDGPPPAPPPETAR
jgi:small-conductance mechanosensitive channel